MIEPEKFKSNVEKYQSKVPIHQPQDPRNHQRPDQFSQSKPKYPCYDEQYYQRIDPETEFKEWIPTKIREEFIK